jgi:hypothetical protein
VVINVNHDNEPRVVNLSLRQTLPSERRSSLIESSDVATLERVIGTKTARLKDSMRRDVNTARDGLSHREKAMVREIADITARSIRKLSKKSERSSGKSGKKLSLCMLFFNQKIFLILASSTTSSSSSSSSSTPSDRFSRSRRTSSSSRYSSDRSGSSHSSRSGTSHNRSSSRSSSNRSRRLRK